MLIFFITKDYQSDLADVANSGEVLKIIEIIKEPIGKMEDVNKVHTSKYLQLLSKLSLLYNQA